MTADAVTAIERAIHFQRGPIPSQYKYVRALAYKVDNQLHKALNFYKDIMKNDETIYDYTKMMRNMNIQRLQNKLEDSSVNF